MVAKNYSPSSVSQTLRLLLLSSALLAVARLTTKSQRLSGSRGPKIYSKKFLIYSNTHFYHKSRFDKSEMLKERIQLISSGEILKSTNFVNFANWYSSFGTDPSFVKKIFAIFDVEQSPKEIFVQTFCKMANNLLSKSPEHANEVLKQRKSSTTLLSNISQKDNQFFANQNHCTLQNV